MTSAANPRGSAPVVGLVIPCYNEAERINLPGFGAFLEQHPQVYLVFVNDGSTDGTRILIENFCASQERADLIDLPHNQGKGEAVRAGMKHCCSDSRLQYAGFWDADLATPLEAVFELLDVFDHHPHITMVAGARVQLLGRSIKRRPVRHYAGRVFATLASTLLGLPVYDTQCGAKMFRINPKTHGLFEEPFTSRWVFDVEIFARLNQAANGEAQTIVYEYPLRFWQDVAGSKLTYADFYKALRDLLRISKRYHLPSRRG